ncbi:MAG: hypothetical protein KatS3mg111_1656 [Pirellulaceae bacterium]|nr:MAG: hypothetical protein KatS3mg111_1656 [Pirellulaceae bacterium]
MKRFYCECGQELFFENDKCEGCGRQVGFDPSSLAMFTWFEGGATPGQLAERELRYCGNMSLYGACNWLIDAQSESELCLACRCNRTIPNLKKPVNRKRWKALERAKRRLVYSLLRLGLRLVSKWDDPEDGLWFDFLEDKRSDEEVDEGFVTTGHAGGVITINVLEADASLREAMRESMNEPYRTLLGHFRHESGHYYWQSLVADDPEVLTRFRRLFGDESIPYDQALSDYYATGPVADWQQRFVSAYASAHPLEDWAETWGHYLHMTDTLETAMEYRFVPAGAAAASFDERFRHWESLTVALNSLNRSMGLADAYPFVLSPLARQKLAFVDHILVVQRQRGTVPQE